MDRCRDLSQVCERYRTPLNVGGVSEKSVAEFERRFVPREYVLADVMTRCDHANYWVFRRRPAR